MIPNAADDSGHRGIVEDFATVRLSGRSTPAIDRRLAGHPPLVVAIHGGTYTSRYFDLPGYSLLDRAKALGIPLVAPDRPGYGDSVVPPPEHAGIEHSALLLDRAIGAIFARHGADTRGVVLVGHSIGAAIAAMIAARRPAWPLLGLAMSGICLTPPPGADAAAWEALPDIPFVDMPREVKDRVMFGAEGTYRSDMPDLGHLADAPIPRAELLDIVTVWPERARETLAQVKVPVHYRQGEFDRLWVTDAGQVAAFAASCRNAPSVDAALFRGAGHCIDLHAASAAFHLDQLAFALRCGIGGSDVSGS